MRVCGVFDGEFDVEFAELEVGTGGAGAAADGEDEVVKVGGGYGEEGLGAVEGCQGGVVGWEGAGWGLAVVWV